MVTLDNIILLKILARYGIKVLTRWRITCYTYNVETKPKEMYRMKQIREAQWRSPVHAEMDKDGNHRIISLKSSDEVLLTVTNYLAGDLEPEVVYVAKPFIP